MVNEHSRLMAIKLSVSLGEQMRDSSYNIASGYTHGFTHSVLADGLKKLPEFSKYGRVRLMHAVRYALLGNDDAFLGPVYTGVISTELYKEHSKKHQVDSGKSQGKINVIERRGFHGLDTDKLKEFAIKSAIAKGMTPWTREELSRAFGLSLSELFKREGHIAYESIAADLNHQFYGGKRLRTGIAVKDALKRLQHSFDNKAAAA
jgi:hypothetical protein